MGEKFLYSQFLMKCLMECQGVVRRNGRVLLNPSP